jgi:macrolide transport system ATP-binding/permease protein
MRTLISRILGLFSRRGADRDFDREIEAHLEMLIEENMRRGMTAEQARHAARQAFGGVAQITLVKETQRENRGLPQIDSFFKDLRYAARMLVKHPGFTLVAVITLALGIGVNTTLFTAFNAVALKPLPVRDPHGVARIERWFESNSHGDIQYAFSYPEYVHLAEHNRTFLSLIAVSWPATVLATLPEGEQESLRGNLVSANFFTDLGIGALLGRTFLAEEHRTPGTHPVVVLSHEFWQRRFHSDPQALGKIIKINDTAFTIVGVTPEEFIGTGVPPTVPDFWTPLMMQAELRPGHKWLDDPLDQEVQILARAAPGVTWKQAAAETIVLEKQFEQLYPSKDKTLTITIELAHFIPNTNDPRFEAVVALMMIIVGMVLFIACANLANMLLARSAARQKEFSVRLALGAGRGRLIRQLLTESMLLALLGGGAGLLLSIWTTKFLWIAIQQYMQGPFSGGSAFVLSLSPDVRVFTYTLLLSVATGILFGLWPALRFSRPDLTQSLKDEGTAFGQRVGRSRLRSFLVSGQVGVSLMLLITAGLLVRGLVRSQEVDPGFDTRNVHLLRFNYGNDAQKAVAMQQLVMERLRELPQVLAVTLSDRVPMSGTTSGPIETDDTRGHRLSSQSLTVRVAPEYFETLGISLLNGRNFTALEVEKSVPVAIVSELAVRQMWPEQNPIGRRFKLPTYLGSTRIRWDEWEVVGVAKSVRSANLSRLDPMMVYLPLPPKSLENILVRTDGDEKNALSAIRTTLASIDRNILASLLLVSLEDGPLRFERVQANIWAMSALSLAALALVLATVGIYGVMSYLVSQQTKEIGILIALGASARDVLRSVILAGLRPVFMGSIFGLAGAGAVSAVLHAGTQLFVSSGDPLFGLSMFDPITFLGLSALLALVALLASALPAWRALRVDPMIALRYE